MDSCNSQPPSDIALYVINFSGVYHGAERSVRSLECSNANGVVTARGACRSQTITPWTSRKDLCLWSKSLRIYFLERAASKKCVEQFFRSSVGHAAELLSAADVPRAL